MYDRIRKVSIPRLLAGFVAIAVAAGAFVGAQKDAAAAQEVKIAFIAPLSGPWARQGELMLMGAKMAIADINAGGGIKALGGAKMRLIVADAGDTAEKAKNAAQRLVAQHKDLLGGTGSWLSSFTLGVTEVTERAKMPWLTLSYSDKITERGFKYVFQTSPTAGTQSQGALPALLALAKSATGKAIKTVGILSDNTASPMSFAKPIREGVATKLGIKIVMDEIFTPPLSDATALVQKVRATRPDLLLFLASNIPDDKLLLEKLKEMGLGKGKLPVVANGAHIGTPELGKAVGTDNIEGLMFIVANWPIKGQEELIKRFKKRTGEPWIGQDSISTYGDMWIFKEAIETAGSADREKVAEAIRKMDRTDGPAAYYPGGRLRFEKNGRRANATVLVAQWQNGVPVTVYPLSAAVAKPFWPTK